ncbi:MULTISPECIES: hypothetical protein [unclassified Brucella]|nr:MULTISPECIES: hypothetical protein [unclassified Brucella]
MEPTGKAYNVKKRKNESNDESCHHDSARQAEKAPTRTDNALECTAGVYWPISSNPAFAGFFDTLSFFSENFRLKAGQT